MSQNYLNLNPGTVILDNDNGSTHVVIKNSDGGKFLVDLNKFCCSARVDDFTVLSQKVTTISGIKTFKEIELKKKIKRLGQDGEFIKINETNFRHNVFCVETRETDYFHHDDLVVEVNE